MLPSAYASDSKGARYHVGEWNFLAGGRMHLIILLILLVALVAIIVWLADWTSGPRSS
jgi:uncharacterized membrane protein